MKTYTKNYIGKGTKVPNLPIVKVTVKVSELLKHKYTFEDEEYVTFEVAKMLNRDKFDRSHTVYCTTQEEVEEQESTKPPRKKRETANA